MNQPKSVRYRQPWGAQRGTNVERGVIVGGVLICVSFLLAVFLNHSASERRDAGAAAPLSSQSSPRQEMPTPAAVHGGGSPACRSLATPHPAEHESAALVDEGCPANQP